MSTALLEAAEDVDLMMLNNQAVLAYLKQNYQQCLDMFHKFFDVVETNPLAYFNYLVLCWEAGIYNDSYVLTEIHKLAHISPNQNFSSFMYAQIYEA